MRNIFSRLLSRSSGFTLAETLVALSIMGLGMGLVGSGIFQSLVIERVWVDDVMATRDVRHAGSWLAGDAMNAQEVCDPATGEALLPGGGAVDSVTLVWFQDFADMGVLPSTLCDDSSNFSYTRRSATFEVSGVELTRILIADYGVGPVQEAQTRLSARVVSAGYRLSPSGDVLIFELEVQAEDGSTEYTSLETYLRRLRG